MYYIKDMFYRGACLTGVCVMRGHITERYNLK